jgi:hypothetical protein
MADITTDPRVLTSTEMEALKLPSSMKLKLRWIYLALGIIGIIASILFYVFAWTADFAVLQMTYDHETFDLNLSILFGSVLLTGSLMILSQVWMNTSQYIENSFYIPHPKLSQPREPLKYHGKEAQTMAEVDTIHFRHFSTSRLIAAVLMLSMASINISTFGTLIDTENHIGEWFFLGGPSMFYPMSAFMLLVGLGLLLHTIFSTAIIRFQKTEHFYTVEEYRILLPWKTEIPIEEIEGIRITNAKTGPKFFWVILMAWNLILCFTDGIHLLTNPFAFGAGLLVGKFYIITAVVHLIALCILVLKHQMLLEIITKEKRYELYFSPPSAPIIQEQIHTLFDVEPTNSAKTSTEEPIYVTQNRVQDWRNIVTGLLFLVIAILSAISYSGAGAPLRIPLYIFGVILVFKGLKEDFTNKDAGLHITHDLTTQDLFIQKKFGWLRSKYKFPKCEQKDVNVEFRLTKLTVFEILMAVWVPFAVAIDLSGIFYFTPIGTEPGLKFMHLLLVGFLLALTINMLFRPTNTLVINKEHLAYEYPLPGTFSPEQAKIMEKMNIFQIIIHKWRYILQHQSKASLIRGIVILEAFLGGIVYFGRYVELTGLWIFIFLLMLVPPGWWAAKKLIARSK